MSGLKAEIALSDYITFKGQRYEVRLVSLTRNLTDPDISTIEKQIILVPVPDAPPPAMDKME